GRVVGADGGFTSDACRGALQGGDRAMRKPTRHDRAASRKHCTGLATAIPHPPECARTASVFGRRYRFSDLNSPSCTECCSIPGSYLRVTCVALTCFPHGVRSICAGKAQGLHTAAPASR